MDLSWVTTNSIPTGTEAKSGPKAAPTPNRAVARTMLVSPCAPREEQSHEMGEMSHREHHFLASSVSIPHSPPRVPWFALGEILPLLLLTVGT